MRVSAQQSKELVIRNKASATLILTFAAFIVVGLALAWLFFSDQQAHEGDWSGSVLEAQAQAVQAALAEDEVLGAFAKLSPASALKQCRQSWEKALSWSVYYLPIAVAWSHQGLDGYYLQGVDVTSMRHFQCSANGSVLRGKRFVRPGMLDVPAEIPYAESLDPMAQKLDEQSLTSDLVALELYFAPDQNMIVRRWQGAEQLEASLSPADALLPLLLQSPPAPIKADTNLQALVAHNWLLEPAAALEVLAAQLPENAKVMKVRLNDVAIEVTIEGPIPAFENKPPAPSGDLEYDEYGVAERSWWYPREVFPSECGRGETLASVISSFNAQYDAQKNYSWLIYNCAKGWQMRVGR